MSREKQTSTSEQKVTQTPEEKRLNQINLGLAESGAAGQQAVQAGGLQLSEDLFRALNTGSANSNVINQLLAGISPEMTTQMSQRAVQDILPSFQSSGILDSGVAANIAGQVAGETRLNAAQYNLGNLFNLANLAGGQGAQVQAAGLQQSGQLGNQLAGLRTVNTSGTQTFANPFLKSFQQSAGQSIGGLAGQGVSGAFGALPFPKCWVAAEIFGGWYEPKTCAARYYINNMAPKWFDDLYTKHGESFAKFISNKPLLKLAIRPLFEMFAIIGRKSCLINK